jgi:hypothetical protein
MVVETSGHGNSAVAVMAAAVAFCLARGTRAVGFIAGGGCFLSRRRHHGGKGEPGSVVVLEVGGGADRGVRR